MKLRRTFLIFFGAWPCPVAGEGAVVMQPVLRNPFIPEMSVHCQRGPLVTACVHEKNTVIEYTKHHNGIHQEIMR